MRTIILIYLILFSNHSYSEIYKWIDDRGKVHFSDKEPVKHKADKIELKKLSSFKGVTFMKRDDTKPAPNHRVVMYSTEWCVYCKKARKYFNENNILFADYDIEKDPVAAKEHKDMGASGVPVILVGNERMNGFNESGFKRIYNQ